MATHSYWGQDRPWQLQTLHAEASQFVLVTVDKPGSAIDLLTWVLPARCDLEILEDYRGRQVELIFWGTILLPDARYICLVLG